MNLLTKIFVTLAITCCASWLLKMVAIVATGGADGESAVVGVLWAAGMLTFLLASATGTALLLRRARVWARVAAAIVAVPASFLVLEALDSVVDAVYKADGWFAQEVPLVLIALALGAVGLRTVNGLRQA